MIPEENRAIWYSASQASRDPLDRDLEVAVAIVGGGLMGITAALELARAGVKVVVLERRWVGSGETGHTTAHVTARPETPLHELLKRLNLDGVTALWRAMDSGLRHIETRSEQLHVPFARVDAWQIGGRKFLEPELELLLQLGASADLGKPPAPLPGKLALRVRNQARFDVAQYLRAITEQAQRLGALIFEDSAVIESSDSELKVETPTGVYKVRAEKTIIATHVPLFGNPLLLDRLRADQSYAVAAAVAAGSAPDVLAEDTENPYHYYRLERGAPRGHAAEDIVIFGGEDHATGGEAKRQAFDALEKTLDRWLPDIKRRALRRWSGEIWTSSDGVPIIGEDGHGRYFATGFGGVGMTLGTLAGTMAADWATGRGSSWADLFQPSRFSISELPGVLQRGASFMTQLVTSVVPRKVPDAESLKAGEGALVGTEGGRAAAYRDLGGALHLLNPRCTHAGCELHWNEADTTWDCGCHGSRFTALGEVRAGPAIEPMKALEVKA